MRHDACHNKENMKPPNPNQQVIETCPTSTELKQTTMESTKNKTCRPLQTGSDVAVVQTWIKARRSKACIFSLCRNLTGSTFLQEHSCIRSVDISTNRGAILTGSLCSRELMGSRTRARAWAPPKIRYRQRSGIRPQPTNTSRSSIFSQTPQPISHASEQKD